ncbi:MULTISPECIES: hypothetical protein [Pseudomonas syringae group]|uniref:RNA polymerase alpha subunit C-terminal domain-containing protein n=1 Tax=Pseudomonas syringae pv. coriandricola TaxID=264453 RepID=A0A3M3J8Z9_9PSED|nr:MULTISPECIES: hypothetical protein [Pseudomonas syringae group]RMN07302.1 hypothetical protein ALQ65_200350 [Pseudomonas syringae pv. coriandricola]
MTDLMPKYTEAKKNNSGWHLVVLKALETLDAIRKGATYSDIATARKITKPRVAQILGEGFRAMQKYDPLKRFGEGRSDSPSPKNWQKYLTENSEEIGYAICRSITAIVTPLEAPLTLESSVDALNISSRARNYLRAESLTPIIHLVSWSKAELAQVLKLPCGCLAEIVAEVEARGLSFRPD